MTNDNHPRNPVPQEEFVYQPTILQAPDFIGAPCARCRAIKIDANAEWNATVVKGHIVGFLCPKCQTAEEYTEAQINFATTDYSRTADGRLVGRPKRVGR